MSGEQSSGGARSAVNSSRNRAIRNVSSTLLRAFDNADFGLFFRHWPSVVSNCRDQSSVRHLDFYIRVYFATRRFRSSPSKMAPSEWTNRAMENFKRYLESSAASDLSKNVDLMPYFALPYVKNIDQHHLFKDLKDEKWATAVRTRLVKFLEIRQEPSTSFDRVVGSDHGFHSTTELVELRNRVAVAERKHMFYKKRCAQLQVNYHRLILVTSELVDALEQAVQGVMITPEQIEDLRSRMFDTRGSYSSTQGPSNSTEEEEKPDGVVLSAKDAPDDPEPSTSFSNSVDPDGFTQELHYSGTDSDLDDLDWISLKRNLTDVASDKETALLLQALRWSLTKCDDVDRCRRNATAMIRADCLSLIEQERHTLCYLLSGGFSSDVQESTCRLLNALSCMKSGRTYLVRSQQFLDIVIESVKSERLSQTSLCHLIATLQKCSIRRKVQSKLISSNLLKWLINFLQFGNKTLSNYALEYATALLMNLSLTTTGKKMAAEDPGMVLNLLCDLMEHENASAISCYVNGTLFSILSLPNVRHKAKKMGLYAVLDRTLQRPKAQNDVVQIPFIIRQLNGELKPPPSDDDHSSSMDENEDYTERETVFINAVSKGQALDILDHELDEGDALVPDDSHKLAGFELLSRFRKSRPVMINGAASAELKNKLDIERTDEISDTVTARRQSERPEREVRVSWRSSIDTPRNVTNTAASARTIRPVSAEVTDETRRTARIGNTPTSAISRPQTPKNRLAKFSPIVARRRSATDAGHTYHRSISGGTGAERSHEMSSDGPTRVNCNVNQKSQLRNASGARPPMGTSLEHRSARASSFSTNFARSASFDRKSALSTPYDVS